MKLRSLSVSLAVIAAGLALNPFTATAATAPPSDPTDLSQRLDQQEELMAKLDAEIADNQRQQDQIASVLAEMARVRYQTQGTTAAAILHAGSVIEAWSRISEARLMATRERDAQARLQALKRDRTASRTEAEHVLQDLQAERAAADAAASAAMQARLQAQLGAAQQVVTHALTGSSPGNHFTYGYCTWYVAEHRPIPWFGNAIEWWGNAAAAGYAEGSAPRPGAIMVTRESSSGHVALVESVGADGSWTVSEMNFVGWGVVSRRTIRPGQVPLVGFIY